jgi:hypothetical protein
VKQTAMKGTGNMLHKIELIEKEVKDLKLSLIKKLSSNGKKVIKLKGIIKGVETSPFK